MSFSTFSVWFIAGMSAIVLDQEVYPVGSDVHGGTRQEVAQKASRHSITVDRLRATQNRKKALYMLFVIPTVYIICCLLNLILKKLLNVCSLLE